MGSVWELHHGGILEAPCTRKRPRERNGFTKWQSIMKASSRALGVDRLGTYQTPSLMPWSGRWKLSMEIHIFLLLCVPKSWSNDLWTRLYCKVEITGFLVIFPLLFSTPLIYTPFSPPCPRCWYEHEIYCNFGLLSKSMIKFAVKALLF